MADRTSAGLFAMVFELLAKSPTEESKAIARKFWRERLNYDFSDFQMECDRSLIKLGLACKTWDKGGESCVQYAKPSGRGWEKP